MVQLNKDDAMDVGMLAFVLWFFTLATAPFAFIPFAVAQSWIIKVIVPAVYLGFWLYVVCTFVKGLARDSGKLSTFGLQVIGGLMLGIIVLGLLLIGDAGDVTDIVTFILLTISAPPYALIIALLLLARRKIPGSIWLTAAITLGEYVWVTYRMTDGFSW